MTFTRDIETRSTVDLTDVGLYNYATHPTTEVLCVGCCVDDGPVEIWHPGEPIPRTYIDAKKYKWPAIAHNASFEHAIEKFILTPRYGFPLIPLKQNICTQAIASSLALPPKLENLAKVLNLENQKDTIGNRLMLQLSKPRRPRRGEDPDSVYFFDDAERLNALDEYCIKDILATREAAEVLPWLSPQEHALWVLDQLINMRGIPIDLRLVNAARKIIAAAGPRIDREITKLTDGKVTTIHQVAKLTEWLGQYCVVESLDKKHIDELLELELPADAHRAVELRYLGAQAAAKKVDALLMRVDSDTRVRHAFVYHAAGPGRWSSRGVQVHNLKRSLTEDLNKAVDVIGRGNFDYACKHYDNPLSVIGDLIRAMIKAGPGNTLIGADFSGIEARVTAWLAGEEKKLEVFREFDAGRGPDPYIVSAAKIFNLDVQQLANDFAAGKPEAREQRQIGKACELAFGYQGGVHAFRRFTPSGGPAVTPTEIYRREGKSGRGPEEKQGDSRREQIETDDMSDLEINRIKNAWRRVHPKIQSFWLTLHRATWRAVKHPGARVLYDGGKLVFESDEQPFLWITLPSGRKLAYPHARIEKVISPPGSGLVIETPRGTPALIFKDNASGQWRNVRAYGGFFTENIVQAVARDLLAEAMLRIDAAGINIVSHVHDEIIAEVDATEAERTIKKFSKLMVELPAWAKGLPVVSKAWQSDRYVK